MDNKNNDIFSKSIDRRHMIKLMGSTAAVGLAWLASPAMAKNLIPKGDKPNIIFILCDNVQYDDFGFMNHPFIQTPGVDSLARDAPGRKACLLEFWKYYPENTPSYVGVRTMTHKYVEYEKTLKPQIFDLVNDPREQNNLYGTQSGRQTPA